MSTFQWLLRFPLILSSFYHGFPSNDMMPHVTYSPYFSSLFDLLTTRHVPQCEPLNTYHMSRVTLVASKNVKFRLSRNSTKFDAVTRFRETIPTVKSISSSEIYKNSGFLAEITILPFFRKLKFSWVLHLKSEGLKSEMTQTSLGTEFCPITKYFFKVIAQLCKFINSPYLKFSSNKKIISKSTKLKYESQIKLFRI